MSTGAVNPGKTDAMRISVYPCIINYPHLYTPKAWEAAPGDTPKKPQYMADFYFLATDQNYQKNLSLMQDLIERARIGKFGSNNNQRLRYPLIRLDHPDIHPEDPFIGREGYRMRAKSPTKPAVRERNPMSSLTNPEYVDIQDPERVYSGCIVGVSVTAGAYQDPRNSGINFFLNQVLFLRDGQRLAPIRSNETVEEAFDPGIMQFMDLNPMAHAGGFDPSAANAPPQHAIQQGYAPQQPGYPPQQQQFVPQQQFAPQQPGYPPQQQFVPQQPGYAPQPGQQFVPQPQQQQYAPHPGQAPIHLPY